MSFLKNYFKPGSSRAKVDADRDDTDEKREPAPAPAAGSGLLRSRNTSKPGSLYPHGDFREGRTHEAVVDIKYDVMVNWLQQQQLEYMWSSGGPDEGVVLKKRANQFVACPADLADERGGLFDAIKLLNVKCAMTVKTRVIQLFLDRTDVPYLPLSEDLRLQIIPSVRDLPRCQKHHFAAFVEDISLLIVWQDDPKLLLEKITSIEKQLLDVIWRSDHDCDDEKGGKSAHVAAEEVGSEVELGVGVEPSRRLKLHSSLIVALTMVLLIASMGAGWRQIAVEIAVDQSYIRIAFLAVVLLQLWLALFFMQSVAGCIMQCIGPVQQLKQNSRYFSSKPPERRLRPSLPHVTVQCPVYKESLTGVIEPTIRSIKAAISTYEMQGGTANIFVNDDGMRAVSEEEGAARRDFFDEHNIGWVARPKDRSYLTDGTQFHRAGRFKKASNMNYALAISTRVEQKLAAVERTLDWNNDDERAAYSNALEEVLAEDNGDTLAEGSIRVGDYILLVDSDTRVPEDCFFDATHEMDKSPQAAIIQFKSGVMNVTTSYFERGITFFTNLIYTAIAYAVSCGDVAPFVGHNAILRWSALQDVAYETEGQQDKYWSESTVSEDFDMALRLQAKGYHIRYADYFGEGFKEGVSLTVYDELLRWEKYAFGCSELIFNPFSKWFTRGPFTPLFRRFICSVMPLPSKLTIMAYIGTYYAIGSAWILTMMNYIIVGWYNTLLDHYYLDSFKIFFSIVVVFTALGNVSLAVLRYRQGSHNLFASLYENFKWVPLLAVFLGGISMHVSWALCSHLLGVNVTWGSTAKEAQETTLLKELKVVFAKFGKMLSFCFCMIAVIAVMAVAVPPFWQINTLIAIFPLCNILASHILLPLVLNPGMMLFSF